MTREVLMTKIVVLRTALVVALACISPASAAQTAIDKVPVYDSTQIALDGYTVVKRLWVEGWRSAFSIPGHRDEESAKRAIVDEAARIGADAVVNLHCMSQTDGLFNRAGYYCYANAIKAKRSETLSSNR